MNDADQDTYQASRLTLGLFLAGTLLFWTSLYVYVPKLSPYAETLSGSKAWAGIVVGSYGLTQLILRIPIGFWADRVGRGKFFILAGLALSGLSALLMGGASNVEILTLGRGLSGVSASMWVCFSVCYAAYFSRARTTSAISHISGASATAIVLGTYIGGLWSEHFGVASTFMFGAVLSVLGLACFLPVRERVVERTARTSFQLLKKMATHKMLLSVSFIAALNQYVVYASTSGFTANYAETVLGASPADLGLLMTLSWIPYAAGSFVSGTLVARYLGDRATIVLGAVIMAATVAVIPWTTTYAMLVATQMLGGLGRGLTYPMLMAMSIRDFSPEERATAMGFFQAIYALGMFAGPTASGFVGDVLGFKGIFLSSGLVALTSAIWSWFAVSGKRKHPSVA